MEDTLRRIEEALNRHWDELSLRFPAGSLPKHRVEFSTRVTTSWALIYFRRHLIRLSPYVFLLDKEDLTTETHWKELDATLRHEMAHAFLYYWTGEKGHTPAFGDVMRHLGMSPNGSCDIGPPNPTFRYVYGCGECGNEWTRRRRLTGNWSCGDCAPGVYDARYAMTLQRELPDPRAALAERTPVLEATLREALRTRRTLTPSVAIPARHLLSEGPAEPAATKRGRAAGAPRLRRA